MILGLRAGAGLALAAVFLLSGCTDAVVEARSEDVTQVDNRLTLTGRVCTAPRNPEGFPVKVVIVIDESGSMCVSDPPGSQEGSGFCEKSEVKAIVPPGVTEPARVRALRKLVDQFRAQPNVFVSIVPFETNVKNVWPPTTSGSRFARPDGSLNTYITGLQSQLGKGTDYQGAMAYAYGLIASDIRTLAESSPNVLPRTRYVTVFLTDGTPYPRCSSNDDLSLDAYASPDRPELIWSDSSSAVEFCNISDPMDQINAFTPGTDRNQNYQLFSYVDQMMELKQQYNVGDVRFHSVLLFNEEAVRACGPICQDVYGTYPGVDQAQYPAAAKKIASWLLQKFAERGNGIYQEFNNSSIQDMGLGALDYSSMSSPNVMKTLLLQPLRATPGLDGWKEDSDGDGLEDEIDNTFTLKTNTFGADSDTDCFDDRFEYLRRDEGFVPANDLDARGCDPKNPITTGCSCRDTDGDGLSQFAEEHLQTHPGIMDSDGDGLPDGLEARYKLDPRSPDVEGLDSDGDGLSDRQEFLAGSNPTVRDRDFYEKDGFLYETVALTQPNGSTCYDFKVTNIRLVTPQQRAGEKQGYNLFKLLFAEAPESGAATDYGVWKAACAWAQYDSPLREPLGPELTLEATNFVTPAQLVSSSDFRNRCVGVAP